MSRMIVVVILALIYGGIPASQAHGQGYYSCSAYFQIENTYPRECRRDWNPYELPDPTMPPNAACCNGAGSPNGEFCVAPKPSCAPPSAPSETCLSCSGRTAQGSSPVDFATGNTYVTQSDIRVPGLGGGLSLTRTWNSLLPPLQQSLPSMFGAGWRSNYEERLIFIASDGFIKYAKGDGNVWSFALSSAGPPNVFAAAAPANDPTLALTKGSPSWTLTSKSGEKRLFDATTGLLVSIIDRNGNTTQLSYDSSNRLIGVTDPATRHLNFTYNGSSFLVSSASADVGITYSYAYDGQNRLIKVTKPDNTTISFQYDANFNLTAVLDSDGKVLESHTYDSAHRGLTSSRANGVEAITVTYPH